VIGPVDGHDADAVDRAIAQPSRSADAHAHHLQDPHRQGQPNRANTAKAHGEPLGAEEIAHPRRAGLDHAPVRDPADVYADWDAKAAGQKAEAAWNERFAAYKAHPELAAEFVRRMKGELPATLRRWPWTPWSPRTPRPRPWPAARPASWRWSLHRRPARAAGRQRRPDRLQPHQHQVHARLRFDLAGGQDEDGRIGRHINYGVREFGMAAIMNGVALHGGFIPYGGTFLTFSDYSRNAIRMAALMKQRVIHVFTHDSIGLGEDGPTHQSIEHAASLRLIPNLDVWRPGRHGRDRRGLGRGPAEPRPPTALLLSRQNLPYAPKRDLGDISRGAYVLSEPPLGLKKNRRP
jgi:transketolase